MTILKALPLISQDLMQVLERRKTGKYRSEKNRKIVTIADMKDVLRRYESEMDTDVGKALIYGLNLAIYNKLTDLTNEEFETYITFVAEICDRLTSGSLACASDEEKAEMNKRTEELYNTYCDRSNDSSREYQSEHTDSCNKIQSTDNENTKAGCRRISSGMIPYRE